MAILRHSGGGGGAGAAGTIFIQYSVLK
jgi:hypothetical protein